MAQQELPSDSDLKNLYQEKGPAAVVWYAWRASLRVLPILARSRSEAFFLERTVYYSFVVIKANILLSQYVGLGARYPSTYSASYTAAKEACSSTYSPYCAKVGHPVVDKVAQVTFFAANAAVEAPNAYVVHPAADAAELAAHVSHLTGASSIELSMLRDYEWLQGIDANKLNQFWYRPLWGDVPMPAEWKKLRDTFITWLENLGLDFLGEDLQQLWQGKPIGEHVGNYFKNHSETITNDAHKLRKAILGEEATQENEAVRLLLLGPGGAGKTSLADLMLDRNETKNKAATVGIELTKFEPFIKYYPNQAAAYPDLQFSLWDFGGQAIFHGLHQTFLHENCVYLLVVDSRHEQAPDPWLHQIRASSNGNAKVILITNVYEHCWAKRNETRLMREFPDLLEQDAEKGITSFYYFACNQDSSGYQNFIQDLVNICAHSRKQILASTAKAIVKLTKQFENDSANDAVLFIDKDELAENDADFDYEILPDLEELGHVAMMEDDNLCVNPNLVTKYCYQILNHDEVQAANGYVSFDTIKNMSFKDDPLGIKKEDRKLLRDFMVEKRLACKSSIGKGYYFFPDAANSNEPISVRNYLSQEEQFTLLFDLSYFPNGIHTQLVSRFFKEEDISISNHQEVWRHGFILRDKQSDALAIVQYYLAKSMIQFSLVNKPVKRYSELISQFMAALSGVDKNLTFNSYWVYGSKSISIELSKHFIEVLKGVKGYSELMEEVEKNMPQVNIHGDNNQVISNAVNAEQHKDSHNVSITQNDMDALSLIMKAVSEQSNQQLASRIEQVQNALKQPEIPENKSLLAQVWGRLKSAGDVVGTIDNLQKAAAFVTLHMPLVISALS